MASKNNREAIEHNVRNGQIDQAIQRASGAKDKCSQAALQLALQEQVVHTGNVDRLMQVLGLALATAKRCTTAEIRANLLGALAAGLVRQKTAAPALQLKTSFSAQEKGLALEMLEVLNG